MNYTLDDSKPIFQQIAEKIEDDIIQLHLKEDEQVPSTNQFAAFFQINPATAAKGINLLVDEGILYKKRGLGMFVTIGARKTLLEKRKRQFFDEYIQKLLGEAKKINISNEEIIKMIQSGKVE